MSSFIKVIEIWIPAPDKQELKLVAAIYGKYGGLEQASKQRTFAYDKELLGKAWSMGTPQIINGPDHPYLKHMDPVARAGINAGLAIPLFTGEFLNSVVVILCGEIQNGAGAIELWGKRDYKASEISLLQGYYGSLKQLEQAAQQIQFSRGSGLPGSVWDYHIPMVVEDMIATTLFKRASAAIIEGVTAAIGLPFSYDTDKEYVLTFLSVHSTPIAQRFEIWIPEREKEHLFFHAGICHEDEDLSALHNNRHIKRGEGILGRVWLTGTPAISEDLVKDGLINKDVSTELTTGFVMPLVEEGFLKSMVVFMF
jgi:hypothetical protein